MSEVVISGGGIAGSAAALALGTAGIAVTVIESRPADDDSGAVVRINPNGMDALRAVAADQAVIAVSYPLLRNERVDADGRLLGYRLGADPRSDRGLPRVLHWSDLARALRDQAVGRGATYRYGSPVTDVAETSAGVRAVLADGSTVDGDLLIGADGVRSRIRTLIDPAAPAPRRLGSRTIYGYAADPGCEPPPPEMLRAYLGGRGFFAATRDPRTGGCFWFTSLPAAAEPVPELRSELLERFGDGPGIAATVIARSERILAFDDHALPHLPRWHRDRLIVIGDALHVAPPASEQGAAIGIEDGVVLARCLRDTTGHRAAFAEFERLRRQRVEAIVALGLGGTRAAHRRGPAALLRRLRDRAKQLLDWQRTPPTGGPSWAYDHHLDW